VDYIDGLYSLSNNIESPHKGRYFVDLPQEAQDQVVQYPFIAEVFYGIEDPDVLAIFARLNMNSVSLNAQELRNGRYFGPFKQSAYSLALAHLNFWRNNRIFTELNIARMKEVEFTSELMIALIDGMQDKKNSIEAFYRRYDDNFSNRSDVEDKFKLIIDEISEIIGYDLSRTEFRRTPLFYSMFLSLAHRLFGLPNTNLVRPAARFSNKDRERFRDVIVELSSVISDAKDGSRTPKDLAPFVGASLTQTDNIRPRQVRLHTIYDRAFV
jgi:hypothetical protein